jgi:uncharacterized membrane protein
MSKTRLEAFSDGVIAIILTIMVLELKVPKEPTWAALGHLWPVYIAYALSFGNVLMMWISHHEVLDSVRTASLGMMWANGLLLFFMSLVPFAMAFAAESHWTAPLPVAMYGVVMFFASLGFVALRLVTGRQSHDAAVHALQRRETVITLVLSGGFLFGAFVSYHQPSAALLMYAAVPISRLIHRALTR